MKLRTNLLSVILILINLLTVYSYVILHNETEPGTKIYKLFTYRDDGTAVINIIKPINGTIDNAKVDYPIPEYNFCLGPSGIYYWFDIIRSFPRYLNILYLDIASASYYVLFITRTGKVIRFVTIYSMYIML